MSGALAFASPVRQARPYPRRGSFTTRAPIFAAISGVPSLEPLSTTMTSVERSEGKSASTRPMACASLYVGMMTDTRTDLLGITTTGKKAIAATAAHQRPRLDPLAPPQAPGTLGPEPTVPRSRRYPTPKSKDCQGTETPQKPLGV